jgi:hypothetical protein
MAQMASTVTRKKFFMICFILFFYYLPFYAVYKGNNNINIIKVSSDIILARAVKRGTKGAEG